MGLTTAGTNILNTATFDSEQAYATGLAQSTGMTLFTRG